MIRKHILFVFTLCLAAAAFALAFTSAQADLIWPVFLETEEPEADGINYMVLVNRENAVPETWEDEVRLVHMTNALGDDVIVEQAAYEAYLQLKEALEAEDIHIDLGSAFRSASEQQQIAADFTELHGDGQSEEETAEPGFSEHRTGLALDLYLIINGENIYNEEDMAGYPEIWAKIHEKIADFGFILRYPEGREEVTGFAYTPRHIRFINDIAAAKEITGQGITLEEYLQ